LRKEERRRLVVKATVQRIESQIREYAAEFLQSEYGEQALEKLALISITAIDSYDDGGVSEATESAVKLAAKRDIDAGHLTNTTKLILRHELGHILDESQRDSPDFDEEIVHEKIAWDNAKPKTAAEKWYRNLSIRTHLDPLKMMAIGFPRPETKVSPQKLQQGMKSEIARMHKNSAWVDETLAERYAMANLIENPNYYNPAQ
jgi:hypothetical protein